MLRPRDLLWLLLLIALAFLAGRTSSTDLLAEPQGRQPPRLAPDPGTAEPTPTEPPLVYEANGNSAATSANGILAVTGSYGVGTSVLYVIDTERQQMAVYEARGGAKSTRRLVLVGARRIDLDLQLEGYNDESEFEYQELKAMFAGRGGETQPEDTGR